MYAGTTLLQIQQGENEDVLAVVTATGIQTSKGQLISHILYPQKLVFKYNEELPIVAGLLIVFALIVFPIAIWFQVRIREVGFQLSVLFITSQSAWTPVKYLAYNL